MLQQIYAGLEKNVPGAVKQLIPESQRIWLGYHVKVAWHKRLPTASVDIASASARPVPMGSQSQPLNLAHAMQLPAGESIESLRTFLGQFYIKEDGPHAEREMYLDHALKRFLYTLQLLPMRRSRVLELGAAPYFISLLIRQFTPHELTMVNFFSPAWGDSGKQTLVDRDNNESVYAFDHFNIESQTFPYADGTFDIVLLCEVLEHLTQDPYRTLTEIQRVLRPNGTFILTTPNASRIGSVDRLWAGRNIFDDYSAYGPYGRHNREYTPAEVERLLHHSGFDVEEIFTSDLEPQALSGGLSTEQLNQLMRERPDTLGEYTFVRARSSRAPNPKRPAWLFRSYPGSETATDG